MTIEELKQEILNSVNDYIKDEALDNITNWIKETALPAVKEVSNAFTTALKEKAKNETGWIKFRDAIFLPGLISLALWGTGKLLGITTTDNASK